MAASRITIPEEFYDITSAELLVQPEPQYAYANLMLSALAMDLNVPDALGLQLPNRQISGVPVPYKTAEEDRLELAKALPTEVFATKVDFMGGPGHTMRFNRPKYTNSTYTEASRVIGSASSISTSPIEVGSEQVPLTIKRYAGPYGAAAVQPYAIDAFDAQMGVHSLAKLVGTHLKRDFHRWLDAVWVSLFDLAANKIYPNGFAADNDITMKGQAPLSYEEISRASRAQDEANLPTFSNGKRLLVVSPTGKKQLKDDPQFARYAEFHKEMNPLFPGYFASLPEYECAVSTTLSQVSNSSSVKVHYAHAIAPGVALSGMGAPPAIVPASDDNYGQQAKVIWLAFLAFGLADNRFVTSVRYSEDNS
jgi:hypothetical protein